MIHIAALLDEITSRQRSLGGARTLLVGISGIDAGGKGFIARRVEGGLTERGLRAANINVDGWLHLPARRFDSRNPALHFYQNALRLDQMFEQLVLPLKRDRSVSLTMDFAEETATAYRPQRVEFSAIDVILLEGIFLFKPAYRDHFDLKVWIDCSFETALERAVARGQEGLPPDETVRAFETIYFPAQRIHFEADNPRACADLVVDNETSAASAAGPARP